MFLWPELKEFVRRVLWVDTLYQSQCPHLGLTYKIAFESDNDGWHYNPNDGVVTLLLQTPDKGGEFEYAPNIRSATDENLAAVQAVLEGDRAPVIALELRPGDLQIFCGRYSLHRVTRVGAESAPRHAAIFAYTAEPGVIGRVERTRQLFGRVLPVHEQAEISRVRSDSLRD